MSFDVIINKLVTICNQKVQNRKSVIKRVEQNHAKHKKGHSVIIEYY